LDGAGAIVQFKSAVSRESNSGSASGESRLVTVAVPSVSKPCVKVHVVPTVAVEALAAHRSFCMEARFDRRAARALVVGCVE